MAKFELVNGRLRSRNIILIHDNGDIIHANNNLPLMLEEFGEHKFTDKEIDGMLQNPKLSVENVRIVGEIDKDERINVAIHISFSFGYAGEQTRAGVITKIIEDITLNEILNDINIMDEISTDPHWGFTAKNGFEVAKESIKLTFWSTKNPNDKFIKTGMKLRRYENLNIPNANIDESFIMIGNGNCVRQFLKKKWKRISEKTINKLGDKDGVSTDEIYEFCILRKIACIAYDINGGILKQNTPEKQNKQNSNLYFIAYNNHMYMLKGKIKINKPTFTSIEIVKNGVDKLNYFLEQGHLPIGIVGSVNTQELAIIGSFIHAGIKYIANDEYERCFEILKIFGLEEEIYDSVRIQSLGSIIERKYNRDEKGNQLCNVNTYWPGHSKFVKGGYNYSNYDEYSDIPEENIITTDKNVAYTCAMVKLEYLIQFDYRQNKINIINKPMSDDIVITPHYLYIIDPKYSSLLIPNRNVYNGSDVIYYHSQGLEFSVIQEMTTTKCPNFLRQMGNDIMRQLPKKEAKLIMNVFIGKLESDNELNKYYKIDNLYNMEESKNTDGFSVPISDKYAVNFREDVKVNLYCRTPISIQIKDMSRRILYKKMLAMKLTSKDIIQIKTDCFSFVGTIANLDKPITTAVYGWKLEQFKPVKNSIKPRKNPDISFFHRSNGSYNNKLFNRKAGSGKTYDIINNVIPTMETTYKVFTPSHSTLEEYKTANLNACVSQCYNYGKELPEEYVAIFDEMGLLDRQGNDFLCKLNVMGKVILSYGDFEQLLPVNEQSHFNSPQYLEYLFGDNIDTTYTNYRNDFTEDYYNKLINNDFVKQKVGYFIIEDNSNLINEVRKYSTENWWEADRIIAYRRATREKYNKLYIERLGEDDMFFIGANLRCTTNKLFKSKVYNNFCLTITEIDGDDIIFNNGLTLNRKQVAKFFKLGYAITCYGSQGKSLNSYYYAEEDDNFINSRSAYTIISRLKTK